MFLINKIDFNYLLLFYDKLIYSQCCQVTTDIVKSLIYIFGL